MLPPGPSEIVSSKQKTFLIISGICKINVNGTFEGSFLIEKLLTTNSEMRVKENNNEDLKRMMIISVTKKYQKSTECLFIFLWDSSTLCLPSALNEPLRNFYSSSPT